ncbi:MAG: translational GTPase TypA, partial [Acidimicrobiia bacterium]
GMVIGEASRPENMVVNVAKGKQLTNIRTHSTDEAIKLKPPRIVTLETGIEWIDEDELVEVTPTSIRIRKRLLTESDRKRAKKT